VDYGDNTPLQEAKRDKTLLIIGQPIILHRNRVPIKHRLNAEEINAVLPDIGQALVFVPCKTHGHIVRTSCRNAKPIEHIVSVPCGYRPIIYIHSVQGWLTHVRYADTWGLRQHVLNTSLRQP
jgi:hypothetical protein